MRYSLIDGKVVTIMGCLRCPFYYRTGYATENNCICRYPDAGLKDTDTLGCYYDDHFMDGCPLKEFSNPVSLSDVNLKNAKVELKQSNSNDELIIKINW